MEYGSLSVDNFQTSENGGQILPAVLLLLFGRWGVSEFCDNSNSTRHILMSVMINWQRFIIHIHSYKMVTAIIYAVLYLQGHSFQGLSHMNVFLSLLFPFFIKPLNFILDWQIFQSLWNKVIGATLVFPYLRCLFTWLGF